MKMHLDEKIWLTLNFGMIMLFMLITGYQAFALEMGPPSNNELIDSQKVDQTALFVKRLKYECNLVLFTNDNCWKRKLF
ncbi:hypothetical protein [Bacillus sp. ISL-7]|uniref:hypothetical protein n=1 Tax=Bacillus sp. ISL-7 TaxID=2819136 RepID=UPI0027DEC6CA|nr:hypothetical protein [Bacillus sp. ISL-7]